MVSIVLRGKYKRVGIWRGLVVIIIIVVHAVIVRCQTIATR